MKTKKMPAPRRAGNAKKTALAKLRGALRRLEDPHSLELVANLVAKLASRSPIRRR